MRRNSQVESSGLQRVGAGTEESLKHPEVPHALKKQLANYTEILLWKCFDVLHLENSNFQNYFKTVSNVKVLRCLED